MSVAAQPSQDSNDLAALEQHLSTIPTRFYDLLQIFIGIETVFLILTILLRNITSELQFVLWLPILYSVYAGTTLDGELIGTQGSMQLISSFACAYWFASVYRLSHWTYLFLIIVVMVAQMMAALQCFAAFGDLRKTRANIALLKEPATTQDAAVV